jgi:DNA polymerase
MTLPEPDPLEELSALTAALLAHVEMCALSGATGLEPAPRPARPSIDVPAAVTAPAEPRSAVPAEPRSAAPAPAAAAAPAIVSAPARLAPGDAAVRLKTLAEEVSGCTRCVLHRERKQTVFARGNGSSGVCFIGEGPGADEDEQGLPFVGKAGQLLDRMIQAMGFDREEVYVCNIVKCRPPKNRKPEADEMAACRPYIVEQIALIQPKVIVCMGATAVEGLLGIGGGITRMRGTWRLYDGRIAVMPTFHPAYLLRTPEAKRDVWNDLKEVLKHLGRPVPGTPTA